jgi:hypothetical protein
MASPEELAEHTRMALIWDSSVYSFRDAFNR